MHSIFKTQDYASIPALTLPNIGLGILEAEDKAIQRKQSTLPLRPSPAQQNKHTLGCKDSKDRKKRARSTTALSKNRRASVIALHNSVSATSLQADSFTNPCDVALTYEEADVLSWMFGVLERGTGSWARAFSSQIPELLKSIAVSPVPNPGAPAKIRAAMQNGFLFGKLIELLDGIVLPGLSDQNNPAVAYNNWAKALSALRNNVYISPAHLFIERDLAHAGPSFLRLFLPLLRDLKHVYAKSPEPSTPKQAVDSTLMSHKSKVVLADSTNFTLQTRAEQQHAYPEWKLDAPHSHILQQLRSDMFISYPIEHALCKEEVTEWLEWLSIEPPLFTHRELACPPTSDSLVTNPWCNGYNFHLILSKIYSVLVNDANPLVLPAPDPSTRDQCVQNNSFVLQFAESCGISCAYRILADDFIKPSQCKDTVWSLLSSIVQRFPLPDTLASKELKYSASAALLPYNSLQFSMLEKSLSHWIFTLGFLTDPPYSCDNIPAFSTLIPYMRSGQIFRDISITALRLGIFTHIPFKVSYNSLQNRRRHDQHSATGSSHTKRQTVDQDMTIGLQLFSAQKDMDKTLLEEVCRAQYPAQAVSGLTRFQLVLLVEDIHRCWDKVQSRHVNPEPYVPYAPLSFKIDKVDADLLSSTARERGDINIHTENTGNWLDSTSRSKLWKMEASFVRPPDEVLVDTRQIIPNLWFLPEIRGYPMNYNPENEIVPLFTPLPEVIKL